MQETWNISNHENLNTEDKQYVAQENMIFLLKLKVNQKQSIFGVIFILSSFISF